MVIAEEPKAAFTSSAGAAVILSADRAGAIEIAAAIVLPRRSPSKRAETMIHLFLAWSKPLITP